MAKARSKGKAKAKRTPKKKPRAKPSKTAALAPIAGAEQGIAPMPEPQDDPPGLDEVDRGGPIERALFALHERYENGKKYIEVRAAVMTRFNVVRCTAEKDIAKARELLLDAFSAGAPYLGAELAARYLRVMDKAESTGDYQAVAALGGRLQKIAGLEAPRKPDPRTYGPAGLDSPSQRGRLQELLAKAKRIAEERALPGVIDVPAVTNDPN